jgi:hypothetical protein
MSKEASNISNPKYGYDMVVAATQKSVNKTMEDWLANRSGTPFIQAYVYNPDHTPDERNDKAISFEQLKKDLGFDPFAIPNNTAYTDSRIQKLLNHQFMYAFQAEIGVPAFPLSEIPPIIEFNKEGAYVTYNMVCKSFKIIIIQPELYGAAKWINLSQNDFKKPWVFKFTVDLDLRKDDINNHFHELPPDTQALIKNLGEDMFSVQQLFLDLNAASLSDSITIEGLASTSQAYVVLTQVFLNAYLADLRKDGGIMLGYSVVSQKPFSDNVSLIPTDLNFEISSYKDAQGDGTTEYDAYTINYLLMSKGKKMPSPTPFSWNWLDATQLNDYAGAMSVNRDVFSVFLRDLLSPSLSTIAKQPVTHFSVNLVEAHFSYEIKNEPAPQAYNLVPNGGSRILTYSYAKSDHSSDTFVPNWGNFSLDYTANSDVYLEGYNIRVETTLNMYAHINVDGGVTKGNFATKKSTTLYTIGVDSFGRITVSNPYQTITDLSEKIDPSGWSKFVTAGQINNVVDSLKSNFQNWLTGFVVRESNVIAAMLNGSSSWVFPGGKTYKFQDAVFSQYQDLVANINYK